MKPNDPKRQPNPGAARGMGDRGKYTRSRGAFTWGNIERADIGQLVQDVCDKGQGLVLGRTSDGGALSITILDGDERIREWPASQEDFVRFATWVATGYASDPLIP